MGKYIGENTQYGSFEKQKITVISGIDTYTLNHRVANESSILVVCDRIVLQPIIDYVIIKPSDEFSQKIKFNIDLDALEEADEVINNLELNIVYLGKELLNSSVASIDNIQDVTIHNLLPGQVLQYNGTEWINADVGTTSGIPSVNQRLDVLEAAVATKTYVNNKISDLISSSPGTLDTLNELAAALGDDPNFATTVAGQITTISSNLAVEEASRISEDLTFLKLDGSRSMTGNLKVPSPNKVNVGTELNAVFGNGTQIQGNTVKTFSNHPNGNVFQQTLVMSHAVNLALFNESGQTQAQIDISPSTGINWQDADGNAKIPTESTQLTTKQYVDEQLDTKSNAVDLADVAISGSYNDLIDKPTLSVVSATGSYTDLLDKPTLSTAAGTGSYNDLTDTPVLATVATSGSYNDLTDTPVLATVATSGSYSDLSNKPVLAAVATSGSYNDLADKPSAFVPTGMLAPFAGSSAPTGWLLCDGSAISRTTYSTLFAVIGTTYGAGNGSTTFNVPDLRSRVPVGLGTTVNTTLGSTDGVAEASRSLQHNHTTTVAGHYHASSGAGTTLSTNIGHTHAASSLTVNADGGHTHSFSGYTDTLGGHGHSFDLNTYDGGGHGHSFSLSADWGGSHTHVVRAAQADGASGEAYRYPEISRNNSYNDSFSVSNLGTNGAASSSGEHGHSVSGWVGGGTEGQHWHDVYGWVGGGTEGQHSHTVYATVNGGSHTHTGTAAGQTLATTNVAASGSIGKVTGGADGNIDNTYTSSNKNNTNYILLNYIIKA